MEKALIFVLPYKEKLRKEIGVLELIFSLKYEKPRQVV